MKYLILFCCIALMGCDPFGTIQPHEIETAQQKCADRDGLDEISLNHVFGATKRVICNDGTKYWHEPVIQPRAEND